MSILFLVPAAVAVISASLAVTRLDASHALLFMVIMLLSLAVIFYTIGAPFAAALQVIVYAGAIMVLFLFVVMILGLGRKDASDERAFLHPRTWIAPVIFVALLLGELILIFTRASLGTAGPDVIHPKSVGISLFTTYLLGVELASFFLLGGIVSAFHLGKRTRGGAQ